ncbi:hypothetical protein K1719_013801 [Acacia pycnantha]|nr:hypothetical protein K1719_013801 [Acacia pycnantha]
MYTFLQITKLGHRLESHLDMEFRLLRKLLLVALFLPILLFLIHQGGVVDSTHQGLLFLLCALCPQDVSKIRVGQLSQHGIETMRNISEFLDLKFIIKPDPKTHTVILICTGSGLKNLSRKLSER